MRTLGLSLFVVSLLLVVGCKDGSTAPSESASGTAATASGVSDVSAEEYIGDHPSLPQIDIDCITAGEYHIGMLVSTVTYLAGQPDATQNIESATGQESVELTYSTLGKVFVVQDQGGTVNVISMHDTPVTE